jgi:peroxiredoxin family protein
MAANREQPVVIFLHSGEYSAMHEAFSAAAAATALGRRAELYFFWWALERLIADRLDEPDFGPGREELARDFVDSGYPTARALLQACRETGLVSLFACSGSLAMLGKTPQAIQGRVDSLIGWAAILERTAGLTDRLFL